MTKGPVTMFIGGEISAPEKSNGDGRRWEGEEGEGGGGGGGGGD